MAMLKRGVSPMQQFRTPHRRRPTAWSSSGVYWGLAQQFYRVVGTGGCPRTAMGTHMVGADRPCAQRQIRQGACRVPSGFFFTFTCTKSIWALNNRKVRGERSAGRVQGAVLWPPVCRCMGALRPCSSAARTRRARRRPGRGCGVTGDTPRRGSRGVHTETGQTMRPTSGDSFSCVCRVSRDMGSHPYLALCELCAATFAVRHNRGLCWEGAVPRWL
jgi:hypothetical protein